MTSTRTISKAPVKTKYADVGPYRFVEVHPGLFALPGGGLAHMKQIAAWAHRYGLGLPKPTEVIS